MAGSSPPKLVVLATSPTLRRSTKSDLVRLRQIAQAIEYAAQNCTVNERPLYALLRRAHVTLSNYSNASQSYPPEVLKPCPWEPPERELY